MLRSVFFALVGLVLLAGCSNTSLEDDPMLRPPQLLDTDEESARKKTASSALPFQTA